MNQFRNLLAKLWKDEDGAVIATEYLMLGSIVAAGSATGLASMRDAMVNEYQEFGQSVRDVRRAYTPPLPKKARPQGTPSTDMPLTAEGYDNDRPVYQRMYAGVAP
jgi:Flp pilus assembly pilin Flp